MAHNPKTRIPLKKFNIIDADTIKAGKHDFIKTTDEFTQDMATIVHDEQKRGVYYSNNRKSYIFLKNHENLQDIYNTGKHEAEHGAIDICSDWEDEEIAEGRLKPQEAFFLDDRQEHIIIRYMAWAEEHLV